MPAKVSLVMAVPLQSGALGFVRTRIKRAFTSAGVGAIVSCVGWAPVEELPGAVLDETDGTPRQRAS